MKKFKFFWKDGKISEGDGISVVDAFSKLGFGRGAMPALDCYAEAQTNEKTQPGPIRVRFL